MNKAYRLIWNRAKDAWVIAAEIVTGRGGPPPVTRTLLTLASFLYLSTPALALPVGPQVINGTVSMNTQGNSLTITNTPNSIINWQRFSIAAGETTSFLQQNAASAVLNRVVGVDPSSILGMLKSNGQIFLINPNGVIFGQGARVDAAGLVASTLKMSDADFLGNNYLFSAGRSAGVVRNEGSITTRSGGNVWLIAPKVENSGIITSPNGTVTLAAGQSVHLVDPDKPEVAVVVSAPADQAVNLGSVVAQGGRIAMYGAIVGQKGNINANSAVRGDNGSIYFKSTNGTTLAAGSSTSANGPDGGSINVQTETGDTIVSGTLSAIGSNGKGGTIQILGSRVGLLDAASVDASGATGGGSVLVGGDYQGKNPDLQNAQATYAGKDTSIKADATINGDGGKVIVWSDDTTRAYGSISALGGTEGGNGGFVETSGKNYLDVNGISVTTLANNGSSGTWLLDPTDILITSTGVGTLTGGLFEPASNVDISWSTIEGGLAGGNVLISTAGGSTGSGDITADDGYNFLNAGAGVLTLNAGRDIVLNTLGLPLDGNPLGITLLAGRNVSLNNSISLLTPINITASTGNVSGPGILDAPTVNIAAATGILVNTSYTSTAPMVLSLNNTGAAGMIAVTDTSDYGLNLASAQQSAAGQPITISHAGNMAGFAVSGNVTTNNGAVSFTSSTPLPSAMTFTAAGDISTSGGNINLQNSAANTSINLPFGSLLTSNGGAIKIQSDNMTLFGGTNSINAGTGQVLLSPTTAGTIINIGTSATDGAGTLGINETELSNITTSGGLIIGGAGATGDLSIVGVTPISVPTTLFTDGGIFISNPVNAGANDLTLSSGQAITGNGAISASSLIASATTGIGLTGANNVAIVTLNNSTSTTIDYNSDRSGLPLNISTINSGGDTNITEATGNINLSLTNAGGGNANITASNGAIIDADGTAINVFANTLNMSAFGGIGVGNAIETQVSDLGTIATLMNGIYINNSGTLNISSISAAADILLNSTGPISVPGSINSSSGNASITAAGASSDISVQEGGSISGNNVTLKAGHDVLVTGGEIFSTDSAGFTTVTAGNDVKVTGGVTNNGSIKAVNDVKISATAGKLYLTSGSTTDAIIEAQSLWTVYLDLPGQSSGGYVINGVEGGATVSGTNPNTGIFVNGSPAAVGSTLRITYAVPPPPTLDACIANPALTGCSTVLPSLETCTATPTTPGCTVVLPSMETCTTTPTTPGCSAVLPSMETCMVTPTAPGCTAVLPSLATCTATPAAPGCTVVLPSMETCTTTPTAPGCSAVLPSMETCIITPTAPGCTAVLPSLTTCTTTPTAPGCSAVLPSMETCMVTPTAPGCTAVLPSLTTCTTTPTAPGCSAVLPSMETCMVTPTAPGCTAVLPSMETCTTTPSAPGCSAVLPNGAAVMTESTVVQGINIAVIPTEESDPASQPKSEDEEEKARKEAKAKKDAATSQDKKGEEGQQNCN